MTFKTKAAVLFMLMAIVPISVVSALVLIRGRGIIEQKTIDHLAMVNDLKLDILGHWISIRSRFLASIGALPVLMQHWTDKTHEPSEVCKFHEAARAWLAAFVGESRFRELFLVDPETGRVLVSTDPLEEGKFRDDQAFFIHGKTSAFIQDIVFDVAAQKPVMIFSVPIRDKAGQFFFILAGKADLMGLSTVFEKRNPLNPTEDTYLVNQFNYFITEPRFGKDYALRKSVTTHGILEARETGRFVGSYPDYRDEMVLGEVRWLKDLRLFLVTKIDRSEIQAAILFLQNQVLIMAFVLAGVSALIGGLISETITRPLTALTAAVKKVGAGEFQISLDTSRKGELYDLARSFEEMAGRLKATMVSKEKLEQEIMVRKTAEADLKAAVQALEQSNQDLQQFAYVASHDLQEPLRMVSSFTQLLADRYQDALDEKARTWIRFAVDGAQRMQNLIQDLLSFSRVNTHGRGFEETDLKSVLLETLENLSLAIKETGAAIDVETLPVVRADRSQMVMLFQNLISNSIKFCKDRIPSIRISAQKKDDQWLIRVQDNGIGIDPEYMDKIFIIFHRLHTREEYPGTGLGLAVCKRILQRHGGAIWAESRPGEGTCFYVSLAAS